MPQRRALEPSHVDLRRIQGQQPAGRPGQDARRVRFLGRDRREDVPEARDIRLKTQRGSGRRLIGPELVDQAIQRNDPSSVEGQQREHRPLLQSAERQILPTRRRSDRAEERDPHLRSLSRLVQQGSGQSALPPSPTSTFKDAASPQQAHPLTIAS